MKHTLRRVKLGVGQAEAPEARAARDQKIRDEVLGSIDPTLRSQLEAREPATGDSYRGMKDMIHAAMDSKMHDLGESFTPADEVGAGIEKIVTFKKGVEVASAKKAQAKAAVEKQLADASAQLTAAQQQLTSTQQPFSVELLELQEQATPAATEEDDPCKAEADRLAGKEHKSLVPQQKVNPRAPASKPPKSGCNKPMIKIEDKAAQFVPQDVKAPAFNGHIPKVNDTNPFAEKAADKDTLEKAIKGNFTKAELDSEVEAIRNHLLSPGDTKKTEVKTHAFKPALPTDAGPEPAPSQPPKASEPANTNSTDLVVNKPGVIHNTSSPAIDNAVAPDEQLEV